MGGINYLLKKFVLHCWIMKFGIKIKKKHSDKSMEALIVKGRSQNKKSEKGERRDQIVD